MNASLRFLAAFFVEKTEDVSTSVFKVKTIFKGRYHAFSVSSHLHYYCKVYLKVILYIIFIFFCLHALPFFLFYISYIELWFLHHLVVCVLADQLQLRNQLQCILFSIES